MCLSDQLCLDLKVVGLITHGPLKISQRKFSSYHYCYLHESVDIIQICCMLVKIIENLQHDVCISHLCSMAIYFILVIFCPL